MSLNLFNEEETADLLLKDNGLYEKRKKNKMCAILECIHYCHLL